MASSHVVLGFFVTFCRSAESGLKITLKGNSP